MEVVIIENQQPPTMHDLQTCYLTGMNLTAQLSLLTPDKEANHICGSNLWLKWPSLWVYLLYCYEAKC